MSTLLFGVETRDPGVFIAVPLFLSAVNPKTPNQPLCYDPAADETPRDAASRPNPPNTKSRVAKEQRMRYVQWGTAALFAVLVLAVPAMAEEVTYISKEKLQATMDKGGPVTDGSNYKVIIGRRDKGGRSELHDDETDIFYIMEGSATFVTGGKVVDSKTTSPGEIRGSGISGGETHMLSKGDIIVIPKGTPHWFKEVPELLVYYVVKVF